MDTETMDIVDVDPTQLTMRKPKIDRDLPASSFSKGRYAPDNLRLHVYMYDVHVLKHSFSEEKTFVYFKAAPDILRKLAAIDDRFVHTIIRNRLEYFSNARPPEENTLEDYFARSVIVSASGTVVKLRVKMDRVAAENVPPGRYSFMLYLRGVRFFKNHCYTEWEMLKVQKAQPPFLKLEDECDAENRTAASADSHYFSDDEIVPDPQELSKITDELVERAQRYQMIYKTKLQLVEGYVDQLKTLPKDRSDYRRINDIADTLEELPYS
jgi:hypothetical protein